ncbi:MAG: DNA-binding protein Alba [Candidatus Methanomarinus sp.]|jgi:DNA-binding protein|uniref:DNA-binding protein Alba n=1 Tax=Candidatus Methanomarinus sp. TaxID=3386244 RepID=A0AC61SAP8_9EURY|nr:DNA-binding protein [ANME-2 cluster archaeon]PPA80514.1 MAG: DNA/RNA-binding protein Alba 2 [ANME-2 cluster archaeon HR1]TKY91597.1 MAG: DNA-binding protein Alba [ANME-2 cluster archaeon]
MENDDIVYVGNKPVMNYVLAVVTQFNNGADSVIIKSRGRAISRAVDVAEVARNRFLKDIEVKDIVISTEKIASERGEINVSSMEIFLGK